jgi:hypothetical protein
MEPQATHPTPDPLARLPEWQRTLAAGVMAQRLVPGAVAVGGTAAALYAHHRLSVDTDHVVADLRLRFDEILAHLEETVGWRTVRRQYPLQILGKLEGVEVGYRQLIRSVPIETQVMTTAAGPLVVPTWDELLCIKAFLAYERNRTRDYVDVAALAACQSEDAALAALLKLEDRYRGVQEASVGLEVAKALARGTPVDLAETPLSDYKHLVPEWQDWEKVAAVCRRLGTRLGETLVMVKQ